MRFISCWKKIKNKAQILILNVTQWFSWDFKDLSEFIEKENLFKFRVIASQEYTECLCTSCHSRECVKE